MRSNEHVVFPDYENMVNASASQEHGDRVDIFFIYSVIHEVSLAV